MIELALILGAIAGILTSLGVIWAKGIKPIIHGVKHLGDIADSVRDIPQMVEGMSSLEAEVSQLRQMIETHLKEHRKK